MLHRKWKKEEPEQMPSPFPESAAQSESISARPQLPPSRQPRARHGHENRRLPRPAAPLPVEHTYEEIAEIERLGAAPPIPQSVVQNRSQQPKLPHSLDGKVGACLSQSAQLNQLGNVQTQRLEGKDASSADRRAAASPKTLRHRAVCKQNDYVIDDDNGDDDDNIYSEGEDDGKMTLEEAQALVKKTAITKADQSLNRALVPHQGLSSGNLNKDSLQGLSETDSQHINHYCLGDENMVSSKEDEIEPYQQTYGREMPSPLTNCAAKDSSGAHYNEICCEEYDSPKMLRPAFARTNLLKSKEMSPYSFEDLTKSGDNTNQEKIPFGQFHAKNMMTESHCKDEQSSLNSSVACDWKSGISLYCNEPEKSFENLKGPDSALQKSGEQWPYSLEDLTAPESNIDNVKFDRNIFSEKANAIFHERKHVSEDRHEHAVKLQPSNHTDDLKGGALSNPYYFQQGEIITGTKVVNSGGDINLIISRELSPYSLENLMETPECGRDNPNKANLLSKNAKLPCNVSEYKTEEGRDRQTNLQHPDLNKDFQSVEGTNPYCFEKLESSNVVETGEFDQLYQIPKPQKMDTSSDRPAAMGSDISTSAERNVHPTEQNLEVEDSDQTEIYDIPKRHSVAGHSDEKHSNDGESGSVDYDEEGSRLSQQFSVATNQMYHSVDNSTADGRCLGNHDSKQADTESDEVYDVPLRHATGLHPTRNQERPVSKKLSRGKPVTPGIRLSIHKSDPQKSFPIRSNGPTSEVFAPSAPSPISDEEESKKEKSMLVFRPSAPSPIEDDKNQFFRMHISPDPTDSCCLHDKNPIIAFNPGKPLPISDDREPQNDSLSIKTLQQRHEVKDTLNLTPHVEPRAPPVKPITHPIEPRAPPVQPRALPIEPKAPPLETSSSLIESKPASIESRVPLVEANAPSVTPRVPVIEPRNLSFEPRPPPLQPRAGNLTQTKQNFRPPAPLPSENSHPNDRNTKHAPDTEDPDMQECLTIPSVSPLDTQAHLAGPSTSPQDKQLQPSKTPAPSADTQARQTRELSPSPATQEYLPRSTASSSRPLACIAGQQEHSLGTHEYVTEHLTPAPNSLPSLNPEPREFMSFPNEQAPLIHVSSDTECQLNLGDVSHEGHTSISDCESSKTESQIHLQGDVPRPRPRPRARRKKEESEKPLHDQSTPDLSTIQKERAARHFERSLSADDVNTGDLELFAPNLKRKNPSVKERIAMLERVSRTIQIQLTPTLRRKAQNRGPEILTNSSEHKDVDVCNSAALFPGRPNPPFQSSPRDGDPLRAAWVPPNLKDTPSSDRGHSSGFVSSGAPPPTTAEKPSLQNHDDHLESHEWYFGDIDRETARRFLMSVSTDGCFLVRKSRKGGVNQPYTLAVLYHNHIYNLPIRRRSDRFFALGKEKPGEAGYSSLPALIRSHKDVPLEFHSRAGVQAASICLKETPQNPRADSSTV